MGTDWKSKDFVRLGHSPVGGGGRASPAETLGCAPIPTELALNGTNEKSEDTSGSTHDLLHVVN